jgi:hypothetical protein
MRIPSCADILSAAMVMPLLFSSRSMSGFGVMVPGRSTLAWRLAISHSARATRAFETSVPNRFSWMMGFLSATIVWSSQVAASVVVSRSTGQ